MNKIIVSMLLCIAALTGCKREEDSCIYSSGEYSVYRDSVVQGNFVARALSRKELVSDYISPDDTFQSPLVKFKFSINGADNAAPAGRDNSLICTVSNGSYVSPVIRFSDQYTDSTPAPVGRNLGKSFKVTFRVDMSEVLQSFK